MFLRDCQAGGCPVAVSQGQQQKSSGKASRPASSARRLHLPEAHDSRRQSRIQCRSVARGLTRLMRIADGRGLPAWLVSCQPARLPACGLLKHAVLVARSPKLERPLANWPPADPSLAVTPTDATGRQDRLSPRMGQLILLWFSWHLLGTTLHCLTTLTVLCLQVLAGLLLSLCSAAARSQEAPSVRLLPAYNTQYARPCNARKRIRLARHDDTMLTCCFQEGRLFSYPPVSGLGIAQTCRHFQPKDSFPPRTKPSSEAIHRHRHRTIVLAFSSCLSTGTGTVTG